MINHFSRLLGVTKQKFTLVKDATLHILISIVCFYFTYAFGLYGSYYQIGMYFSPLQPKTELFHLMFHSLCIRNRNSNQFISLFFFLIKVH